MRNRYYIIFVAREQDGRVRKVPIPLHYAYVFVAAAIVGAFTITGMAGSYSRMLLKTSHFNEVRSQREAIRKDYLQMEQVAHQKDIQAASLGSLATEVSALYGLTQGKPTAAKPVVATAPVGLQTVAETDALSDRSYHQSLDQFYALRNNALSGRLAAGFGSHGLSGASSWLGMINAPSLWPVEGRVTSSFGEREDPFNGEGAFHAGIDISAAFGEPIHATADGMVETAAMTNGYGREVVIDHGHGIKTIYGHMSGFAVTSGDQVRRGQVIGYIGLSGRSTGPHVHYEVRIQNIPVNPHKYLRTTMDQFDAASAKPVDTLSGGGY
ncbi:Membrane protein [Acidisarcina polymorpha]|uniref:Membrane protein n=1 Tax=Acidisarcina polymorpha TaxID=2211140 RepID=A0A2Z5FVD1_9BACT|nr:M23 family metallopeptidase [Acidisarcina polymorpha]AXC10811.1 Membrane protein [Acidisarcina polymorpha]